jgi:hypothetical protein
MCSHIPVNKPGVTLHPSIGACHEDNVFSSLALLRHDGMYYSLFVPVAMSHLGDKCSEPYMQSHELRLHPEHKMLIGPVSQEHVQILTACSNGQTCCQSMT